jgi:cobalt-zinc-cadmium efflux system outer membrane protein
MRRLLVAVVAGGLVTRTSTGFAEPAGATLSFAEAIGDSENLPELVGARAARDTTASANVARAWSPVVVTVAPAFRFRPTEQRGLEGSIAVEQAISLGAGAPARRATRDAVAARRSAAASALALESRLAAASAWLDSWAARARLAAAERDLALARSVADAITRGGAAGAFTTPEIADARAFLAEAVARRIDVEGMVADAGYALAAATGRGGRALAEGDLPHPALPDAARWPALVARATRLPAVEARRLAARAEQVRAIEEQAGRAPQIVLGGEVVRDGPGAWSAIARVGVALPHDRGEREAAFARAEARDLAGQAEALARRGAVELERALHDVEHTGELLAALERELVPAADQAATLRTRAFAVGETTVVELLASQRTALAAQGRVSDARATHAWARVRAWLLIQATEVTP